MRKIEIEYQGRQYLVPAHKANGRLWFHWRGETHVLDVNGGNRRVQGAKSGTKSGLIAAPMPGKITKVAVAKGERVQKGQPLIVMEAMKMEYTLEADRTGEVLEVSAQNGAQVTLGQVLVRLGEV